MLLPKFVPPVLAVCVASDLAVGPSGVWDSGLASGGVGSFCLVFKVLSWFLGFRKLP